ncbi:uncharacterized protein LOC111674019 [Orussus abietinus]|uniref:uncharacterized protein LOC111674019 n=1 Tax=Orussus abietinus TaxID=222816 RepID=UPI000C715B79|nr:uncharacterized protein LOC111674019 [Orussus abietinus]
MLRFSAENGDQNGLIIVVQSCICTPLNALKFFHSAYRSNPGTPTQVRRPNFIDVSEAPNFYEAHQGNGGGNVIVGSRYSPQRRFLSESELIRQGNEHPYARTNNTVDNIRELAGSPQRGVYTWKDNSPGSYPPSSSVTTSAGMTGPRQPLAQRTAPTYDYYRSNPTSPTQQPYSNTPRSAYHPAVRGGVPVLPPPHQSPQVKRKASMATPTTPTSGDARRRPLSFVRALEMTDSMEMVSAPGDTRGQRPTTPTPDRASVYDMNYEISV